MTAIMTRALRFHTVVRGNTLSMPDLSAFEGKRVEVIVLEGGDGAEQVDTVEATSTKKSFVGRGDELDE